MLGHFFDLVEIGRGKITERVACADPEGLLRAVKKHLMSSDVSIGADGQVLAGCRPVGRVVPVGDVAAEQLLAWCDAE